MCDSISIFPWSESFENGGNIPLCWAQEFLNGTNSWVFPLAGVYGNQAHSGTYYAKFTSTYGSGFVTKLVTRELNIFGLNNPQLNFWHFQTANYWSGHIDTLKVYYKNSYDNPWILIETYSSNLSQWTSEVLPLPEKSNEYYIAFEGKFNGGYGIFLDDVSISDALGGMPVVNTSPVSSISNTTAITGGNVTTAGSSAVSARGVCWSTSPNPLISGNHSTDGSGTGTFVSNITGLTPNTSYHVRAYATNSVGIAYGNDIQFTTVSELTR